MEQFGQLGGLISRRSGVQIPLPQPRARSSAWLERTPDKREVGGSNPLVPTCPLGSRSTGRSTGSDPVRCRFESCLPSHAPIEQW